tara:strand:+ start:703 stop:1365 length:663 start_codon:yes stop_codon:yes gene_type:complete
LSYGIEVFSSNNTFQLGTTVDEALTVVSSGTISAGNNSPTINPLNQIIAFNRTDDGFIRGNTNSTGTLWTAHASYGTVKYLLLERMSVRAEDSAGDYGIRVFKSDGSTRNYSSNYSKGVEIISVVEPNTVGNAATNDSNGARPPDYIYSGNPTDIYVAPGSQAFNFQSNVGGLRQETFKFFHSGTAGIGAEGIYSFFLFGTQYRIRFMNHSSIIVLKQKG